MLGTFALAIVFACPQVPPPPPMPRPPGANQPVEKGTASIRGRVTSAETGRPLRRAQIRIRATELSQSRQVSTDIEGEYEATDLPAGRYTILVTRSGHLEMLYGQRRYGEPGKVLEVADGARMDRIDFSLQRAGMITGRITDETGEPASGVQVLALQSQYYGGRRRLVPAGPAARTDDTGFYRLLSVAPGDYLVSATLRETWASDEDPKLMLAFAPTFFPGTPNLAEAQKVAVTPALEAGSIDFHLVPTRAASISGRAVGSDGQPLAGAPITLTQEVRGPAIGMMSMAGSTRVEADGSWRLANLAPGEYRIQVNSQNRERPESASTTVVIQGADIEGLLLTANGGSIVSGEVIAEGGGALPIATSPLRVSTQPVVEDMSSSPRVAEHDGLVQPDGKFSWRSRLGPVLFRVSPLPRGWAVKSIEHGGREYAGTPLDVRDDRIDGIRVTLTNRFPTLTGRITDEKGNPAEGTVILFPEDEARWIEAAGAVRTTRPDQSGVYRFDTVRPGEYLIVALESVQQSQVNDPEFLERLRGDATKLLLPDSGTETANLRIRK